MTSRAVTPGAPALPNGTGGAGSALLSLGDRVRIVASKDIEGVLIEHRHFLDGSERWQVEYWHDAKKCEVTCAAWELDRVAC